MLYFFLDKYLYRCFIDLERKNRENTSMMCYLDKTSCSRYNTAVLGTRGLRRPENAFWGERSGGGVAAGWRRVTKKNMERITKYHHVYHVYVIHRPGSYVYVNSDVADRGLSPPSPRQYPRVFLPAPSSSRLPPTLTSTPCAPCSPLTPWLESALLCYS